MAKRPPSASQATSNTEGGTSPQIVALMHARQGFRTSPKDAQPSIVDHQRAALADESTQETSGRDLEDFEGDVTARHVRVQNPDLGRRLLDQGHDLRPCRI